VKFSSCPDQVKRIVVRHSRPLARTLTGDGVLESERGFATFATATGSRVARNALPDAFNASLQITLLRLTEPRSGARSNLASQSALA